MRTLDSRTREAMPIDHPVVMVESRDPGHRSHQQVSPCLVKAVAQDPRVGTEDGLVKGETPNPSPLCPDTRDCLVSKCVQDTALSKAESLLRERRLANPVVAD